MPMRFMAMHLSMAYLVIYRVLMKPLFTFRYWLGRLISKIIFIIWLSFLKYQLNDMGFNHMLNLFKLILIT